MSFSSSLKWTTDASLTSATDEGAADYVNGSLYVIDGFGTSASSSILVYDSALNTWRTDSATDLVARFDVASAVDASGNIYIIDGAAGSATTEVTKFDPSTNTVVQVASTGTARLGAAAATAANGKIYLFGGAGSSGEVYNPITNSWSGIASMPKTLSFESAVADGSLIYVIGGSTTGQASDVSSSVYAYNTTTNTWSAPLASLPTAVMGATAGLVDGMIVVAGGLNSSDTAVTTTQIYDPTTNTWTTASSSMTTAEALAGQGMVSSGSQLFVAGGESNDTPLAALQVASVTPATSQLYFRINNGNDVQLGDINSNGTGRNSIYYGGGNTSGKPQDISINSGNDTAVAVDTAAGLVFSVGIGDAGSYDAVSVHNLNTGALIETVEFGPDTGNVNFDDVVQSLAINPYTDTLYVSDWSGATNDTGVAVFTYNPHTGLVTPATGNGDTNNITETVGNTNTTDTANFVFTNASISGAFTNANALFLDTTHNLLYYVNDDSGYDFSPFSAANGVYVINLGSPNSATELTNNGSSAGQFPNADQSGAGSSIGAHGDIVGLAVDVADGIVFFESTDNIGSSNNALWWVSASGGANQTAHQVTLPGGVTLSFAGQTNAGGDAAGLTFDQQTGQLYLSNADTSNTDNDAIYVLQWNNTNKTVSLVTSYSTETLVGAAPSIDEAPSTTTIDDLPVLTLGSATSTEPVQGGAAPGVTLLTPASSITDTDGDHLASATIAVTSGNFSGDELFVNGQQSGTLDGGAITVSWDNTNKILTLTGYDTLTEYATLFGEVSFQETGNDTSSLGIHTDRTITWQANDGAVGNPSGTNTATTTVIIDRPPPSVTHTVNVFEGDIIGTTSIGDTDPDNDPLTVTAINSPAGSVGSSIAGTYGSVTIGSGDTYSYSADNTGNIGSAATGSHPIDTFTYTVSDGLGGTASETLHFSIDRAPNAVADAYHVNASGNVSNNVLLNDSDPDGDPFTVVDVNGTAGGVAHSVQGTYGELTLQSTGSFTYVADQTSNINNATPGLAPTDIFNYTINDGLGGTSTANITFTVDRPPTVTTSNHTVAFVEGGVPVVIDSGVQVVDVDATGLESATVTISNFQAGDVLGIDPSQLTGNAIDGTNITESYNGNGTLTLSGNDNATDYQIALDDAIFSTTSASLTPRTIQFSATGVTGALGNAANADTVDVVQGPLVTVRTLLSLTEGISTGPVTVATFTDPAITNPTPSDFHGTIDWGDGSGFMPFTSADITALGGGQFAVTGTHTYAEKNSYTLNVEVTDSNNGTGTASDIETVADAPLTAGMVTASGGVEGTTAATLSAAFTDGNTLAPTSDFSGTIDWGDGSPLATFTSSAVTANGNGSFTVSGTHTYAEEGQDTVTVTINDVDGATASETATATVADAPLTNGTVTTVTGGVEGVTAAALSATFTDANLNAPASDFSGTIDWGDNTALTPFTNADVTANGNGSFTVSGLSHLYTEEGAYNVSVVINDVGTSTTTDSGTTTVADAALTAGALTPPVATEGIAFSNAVIFHFTDANPNAAVGDFTATINWGDGHTTAGTVVANGGGGFDVKGGHTYAEEGPYTLGVTVTDVGGASTSGSANFVIADAPLTPGILTLSGGVEGVTAAALQATFTDANLGAPASDFSGQINWGDGNTTSFTSSAVSANGNGSFTVNGSHTYAEDGHYTATVTIDDVGGQFTADTGMTTVADAPLSASGKTIAGTEGVALTATVATFTDANPNAPLSDFTATVNWGDGTTSNGAVAAQAGGGFAVTGTHTYATPASYTTTVTIHDAGGSTAQATGTAAVGTPPLSVTHHVTVAAGGTIGPQSAGDSDPDSDIITVTGITGGTLGSPVNGTYGTLTLNANDTFSYTANNRAAIIAAAPGNLTDAFTYTVSDGHGGTATETLDVTIYRTATPENFTGNGISGVLWRNTTNETFVEWQMNGAAITASQSAIYFGSVTTPPSSWNVVGSGDFNGDGKSDILWQFTDGSLADWTMNGSTISNSDYLRYQGQIVTPGSSWSIAGIGDFNGDGNADLLWRNTNGSLAEWLMNGSTITASGTPTYQGSAVSPDASWKVAAIGDFNGDGDADVVWRQSTTGMLAEWQMNGATINSSANITAQGTAARPDSSWSIAGVGDFNGDGFQDLLWRQSTTGSLVEWLMNGSQIGASAQVTSQGQAVTPDSTWNLLEVGDFNGDGKADLLWQQSTTGTLVEWQMNGTQIASSQTVTSQGAPIALSNVWQVQAFPNNVA